MARSSVKPDSQENRLADEDYEQWDEISTDFGTKITWGNGADETKIFVGTYTGKKIVPMGKELDEEGNPLDTAPAANFTDRHGEKFYCWLNYALDEAIESGDMQPDDVVRIEYLGEEETKRSLNPVKKLNIKRKPRS